MARAALIAFALVLPCDAIRANLQLASVLRADAEIDESDMDATNGTSGEMCCKKCMQNAGCLICKKMASLGYNLQLNNGELHASGGDSNEQFVMTTASKQKIKIAMPTQKFNGEGGSKNCFAYATHQRYQIPAQSPTLVEKYGDSPILRPHEVSNEGLHVAMDREEAIYIGRTSNSIKKELSKDLPVKEGQSYYIVAVFVTPGEEYHFWGLWNNGWYCVSSKISAVAQDLGYFSKPSKQCPMGSIFTLMKSKNPKYNPDLGGFWLFPCRTESCW
jgi:hypothetical protein